MKPLLIGLTGVARSGKDTAGHFFNRNYGFELYGLSWPLKKGLEAMFGLPMMDLSTEVKESVIPWIGKSPRQLMQTLGTEWGRDLVHPDLWVKVMLHRWEAVQQMRLQRMCVLDVRFDNEAEPIRLRGGVIVKLVRPSVQPVQSHPSERGVDPSLIDFTLLNDGTLADLERGVAAILARLGVEKV